MTKNMHTKLMFTDSSLALRMTIHDYSFITSKVTKKRFGLVGELPLNLELNGSSL